MHFMPSPSLEQYVYMLAGLVVGTAIFFRRPGLSFALSGGVLVTALGSFFLGQALYPKHPALAALFGEIVLALAEASSFVFGMVLGPFLGLLSAPLARRIKRSKA